MAVVCRRCLLKDLNREEYFNSIYDYIQSIQGEERTPEEEYRKRLSLCQSCDYLVNGMCRHCGCFVEVRAVKRNQRCPDPNPKW